MRSRSAAWGGALSNPRDGAEARLWHPARRGQLPGWGSLWIVPFIAIPLELVVTRLLHGLDDWLGWAFLGVTATGATVLLRPLLR